MSNPAPEIATYEQAKARILALNAKDLYALSLVAVNKDGLVRPPRLTKLVALGLAEPYEEKVYGRGNAPIDRIPLTITRYRVPTPVHVAWAEACAVGRNE